MSVETRPLPSPQIQLFSELRQVDHWIPIACVRHVSTMEVQSPHWVGHRVPPSIRASRSRLTR
jgi:hypothetical protein